MGVQRRWTTPWAALVMVHGSTALWMGACRWPTAPPPEPGSVLRSVGYTMKLIAAGSFDMGSPEDEPGRSSEEALHPVHLTRGFWIGTTEVTAALWQAVEGRLPPELGPTDPHAAVSHIHWFAAVQFCNHLSALEGLEPAYIVAGHDPTSGDRSLVDEVQAIPDTNGYRLPTEAEWEYAASAGGNGPWANGPGRQNAWQLYDVSGNLWEWTSDRPGPYPEVATDPSGPSHGLFRVLRGGSWRSPRNIQRAAARAWLPIFSQDDTTGLRIVRTDRP